MKRSLSLRARIVLLILLVVVAPLAMLGYWLAGTASRSGEELLRSRLRQTNARVAAELAGNWLRPRSELLSFAESEVVAAALRSKRQRTDSIALTDVMLESTELEPRFRSLPPSAVEVFLLDVDGVQISHLTRGPTPLPTFAVRVPVQDKVGSTHLGTVEARFTGDAVFPSGGLGSATVGAVVAVMDADGASLLPLPIDPSALGNSRFDWNGESWVAERRLLRDPLLSVTSAAPLAEFAQPFEAAAARGIAILFAVTMFASVLATFLTRRMTRSLGQLAVAADTVTAGDLTARVPFESADEVGRVAQAFNAMTESLRRTLAELSHRQALAAVGSFAAELAHEVRNPLTAIKLDIQYVEENLTEGSELRSVQRSALESVVRLDRTVDGVLQIARSGQIELRPLDLRDPLLAAIRSAEPLVREAGATLTIDLSDAPIRVAGDPTALQQLFTNVLVNSAQAVVPGGRIEVTAKSEADSIDVTINDDGSGIPADLLATIRDPFVTTRPGGTGLGLAIASRVAAAHHAEMRIESGVDAGTTVAVHFPAPRNCVSADLR